MLDTGCWVLEKDGSLANRVSGIEYQELFQKLKIVAVHTGIESPDATAAGSKEEAPERAL